MPREESCSVETANFLGKVRETEDGFFFYGAQIKSPETFEQRGVINTFYNKRDKGIIDSLQLKSPNENFLFLTRWFSESDKKGLLEGIILQEINITKDHRFPGTFIVYQAKEKLKIEIYPKKSRQTKSIGDSSEAHQDLGLHYHLPQFFGQFFDFLKNVFL